MTLVTPYAVDRLIEKCNSSFRENQQNGAKKPIFFLLERFDLDGTKYAILAGDARIELGARLAGVASEVQAT
jgi:hypothetical protein